VHEAVATIPTTVAGSQREGVEVKLKLNPIASLVLLPLLLLGLVLGLGSCSRGGGASADAASFNVLIVVLDALRPDKLGCYGFERPTSPEIDALAADPEAVVYRNHHVQGAFTKSSTASLFTGLFPFQHGVVEGHTAKKEENWRDVSTQVLAPSLETMAERLGARGFHSWGVVKSRHLVPDYGFAQGFDEYFGPAEVKNDDDRAEKVLELIDDAPGRFFGYVHFSATHHPYKEDDRDSEYIAEFGFPYDEESRRAVGVDFTTPAIKHDILEGKTTLEPDDVRFLNLVYESSLKRCDRELFGSVVDGLKERGLYDSTLIILTSDHGEELYDHRGYAHAYHVWQEIVHVPMVVKFPKGLRPERLPEQVTDVTSAIDVMPALLDLLGDGDDDLPGVPIFKGETSSFTFTEARRRWGLIRKGWKLIRDVEADLLFDLRTDPGEQNDVAASEPEQLAAMKAFAQVVLDSAKGGKTVAPVIDTALDQDAIDELRQLGYIK